MYVSVSLCSSVYMHARVCVQVATEADMSDGAAVPGSCEPPGVGTVLENELPGLQHEQYAVGTAESSLAQV